MRTTEIADWLTEPQTELFSCTDNVISALLMLANRRKAVIQISIEVKSMKGDRVFRFDAHGEHEVAE